MKKTIFTVVILGIAYFLGGCSTKASRMQECLNEGISKDTCYLAESQRQAAISNASMNAAFANAAHAVQHAQMTHKHRKSLLIQDVRRLRKLTANALQIQIKINRVI